MSEIQSLYRSIANPRRTTLAGRTAAEAAALRDQPTVPVEDDVES